MIRAVAAAVNPQRGKPRASGDDPVADYEFASPEGVNPARAGMIRAVGGEWCRSPRKPRASGDDPAWYKGNTQRMK